MKKAASLCRPPYPFCQVEIHSNILQNVLRKAEQVRPFEQVHTLHKSCVIAVGCMRALGLGILPLCNDCQIQTKLGQSGYCMCML